MLCSVVIHSLCNIKQSSVEWCAAVHIYPDDCWKPFELHIITKHVSALFIANKAHPGATPVQKPACALVLCLNNPFRRQQRARPFKYWLPRYLDGPGWPYCIISHYRPEGLADLHEFTFLLETAKTSLSQSDEPECRVSDHERLWSPVYLNGAILISSRGKKAS